MTVKELIMELIEFDTNTEVVLKTEIGDDILYFPISQVEHFWSCVEIKSDKLDIEISQLYDEIEEKVIGE